MYPYILIAHSWVRWIILILALINIYQSYVGWKGDKPYEKSNNALAASFVGAIHLQALFGLLLYLLYSPYAVNSWGGDMPVMSNDTLRFWSVEHVSTMVVAIAVISIGRSKSKKEPEARLKFKKQFVYFLIGILLTLIAIPYESGRLLRF
jgi:hypothetical protein